MTILLYLLTLVAPWAGAQISSNGSENPEALLNQARVYADGGELDRSISAYERLLEIVTSPPRGRIDPATAARWKGLEPLARLNLGILTAARGLDFFQAERHSTESNFQIDTSLEFTNCGISTLR